MIAVVLPLWLTPTALQGNVMSKFKPLLPSPWTGRISFLDVLYICVCRETSRLITSSEYWKITQKPGIQLTLSFGTKHTVCCTKIVDEPSQCPVIEQCGVGIKKKYCTCLGGQCTPSLGRQWIPSMLHLQQAHTYCWSNLPAKSGTTQGPKYYKHHFAQQF